MCDCIQKIIQRVEAQNCAKRAVVGSFDNQSSSVSYTPIRRDGELSKHNRYTSAKWSFCPWCGCKIEDTPISKDSTLTSINEMTPEHVAHLRDIFSNQSIKTMQKHEYEPDDH